VVRREDVAEAGLPGTDRLLVVSYEYRRARDHPRRIATPLQSESTWFLRLVDSPRRRKETSRCELQSWVVLDRDLREQLRRRIDVDLPEGWFPGSDADRGLAAPVAVSPEVVRLHVPAAGDRRFSVRGL
jgi:hypothetical protein